MAHICSERSLAHRLSGIQRWRMRYLLVVLLAVLVAACDGGGKDDGPSTTELELTIEFPSFQVLGASNTPLAAIGTVDQVTSVTVEVFDGAALLASVPLSQQIDGSWSGSVPSLPIGPTLDFVAHAFDAGLVEIFTGTATQALSGGDTLSIVMAAVDDGVPIQFPVINGLTMPGSFEVSTSGTVSLDLLGNPGETLDVSFQVIAPGGGSFAPALSSIVLAVDGTGTLDTAYTAPSVAGTYALRVRVSNAQGNAIELDFESVVTLATTSASVNVLFQPVIVSLTGRRAGSAVNWTAGVSDDGDLGLLSYAWGFLQTAGTPGASFSAADGNPGVLSAYDQTVEGTVSLSVTDSDGLTTTVSFQLVPGQFPDALASLAPTAFDDFMELFNGPTLDPLRYVSVDFERYVGLHPLGGPEQGVWLGVAGDGSRRESAELRIPAAASAGLLGLRADLTVLEAQQTLASLNTASFGPMAPFYNDGITAGGGSSGDVIGLLLITETSAWVSVIRCLVPDCSSVQIVDSGPIRDDLIAGTSYTVTLTWGGPGTSTITGDVAGMSVTVNGPAYGAAAVGSIVRYRATIRPGQGYAMIRTFMDNAAIDTGAGFVATYDDFQSGTVLDPSKWDLQDDFRVVDTSTGRLTLGTFRSAVLSPVGDMRLETKDLTALRAHRASVDMGMENPVLIDTTGNGRAQALLSLIYAPNGYADLVNAIWVRAGMEVVAPGSPPVPRIEAFRCDNQTCGSGADVTMAAGTFSGSQSLAPDTLYPVSVQVVGTVFTGRVGGLSFTADLAPLGFDPGTLFRARLRSRVRDFDGEAGTQAWFDNFVVGSP